MQIQLPIVELAFEDFALLAILLSLMYLLTIIEALGQQSSAGIALINRKRAATWSFAGILLTVTAGIAAPTLNDDLPLLLIPFVAIANWAYFHWLNSKLLDTQVILTHLDEAHRSAIVTIFSQEHSGLSAHVVRERMIQTDAYARVLSASGPFLKTVVPLPLGVVLDRLMPTQAKTDEILRKLQDEGLVARDGELFRRSTAHLPLPPPSLAQGDQVSANPAAAADQKASLSGR
jgi:hypothetical protein